MKTSFFDIENWREIGATLARNKTRTFLTAFGIFWGTAMLAMLFGGAQGFEGVMRRNFAGFSTNLGAAIANQRTEPYKGFNKGTYWQMTTRDIALIRQMAPAMEYSTEMNQRSGTVAFGSKTKAASIAGVEGDYGNIMIPVMMEGRFLNHSDVSSERKVAVIGKNVATSLFGSDPAVGKYVSVDGIYFLVVGVATQLSDASIGMRIDDGVVLPSSTMKRAYNLGENVGFFVYTAPQGHSPAENEAVIRRVLSSAHSISPDDRKAIEFVDISEQFEMIDNLFLGISILALFVGFGSLMAGVIGVGNIMWIVVKERTQEFGIRRAIGAKPLDITVQVLSESIMLTLVAGSLGVCFGALVLGIADKLTYDPLLGHAGFELSFRVAVIIVLLFFILGSLAGTIPALRAMKIKPIEALNDK
ncbi:MAG: ABC transporter permease [Muribaculaceae bacterium]|nr:ABC transporter permease [Muribaculaceae bacterium]MDE6552541.1 ABC transporter permease [Muribaculaceae bacterium]